MWVVVHLSIATWSQSQAPGRTPQGVLAWRRQCIHTASRDEMYTPVLVQHLVYTCSVQQCPTFPDFSTFVLASSMYKYRRPLPFYTFSIIPSRPYKYTSIKSHISRYSRLLSKPVKKQVCTRNVTWRRKSRKSWRQSVTSSHFYCLRTSDVSFLYTFSIIPEKFNNGLGKFTENTWVRFCWMASLVEFSTEGSPFSQGFPQQSSTPVFFTEL